MLNHQQHHHELGEDGRKSFKNVFAYPFGPFLDDISLSFVVGIVLVGIVRFVCHTVSGVVFFASYAEGTGLSPLVYSLSYNSFVFVDLAIDLVVIAIPAVRRALDRMRPAPVTHAAQ